MFCLSQIVSPVSVKVSFETAPISPATISDVSIWVFPLKKKSPAALSTSSLVELKISVSLVIFPLITLKIEILPINGSTIVLKTTAEKGSFTETFLTLSSSFLKPLFALSSFGAGI